jgi:uncharacterized membrane protein YoaK (UPF0700 family)
MTDAGSTPISPESTLVVACLLSLSGGFLDAFTYVGHGQVFANAMTGNVVLMGVKAAAGDWSRAFVHIPPIVAFLAGVFLAQALRLPQHGSQRSWPALLTLLVDIALMLVIAFLPATFPDFWIVLSLSFAAAVQNSSFRKVGEWPYNSVLTTGNLRRFAEMLFSGTAPRRDPEALDQARVFGAICLAFLAGALVGGLTTPLLHNMALLTPAAILAFVFWRCWRPAA